MRWYLTISAVALSVLVGAGRAAAEDGIFNVVINLSSLSSDSPNDSEVSTEFEISSDAVAGANQFFTSRYGFNLNADSKSVSRSKLASAVHEVTFEVHSSRGYTLLVSTGWVGQMLRLADAPECSDAVVLSGVTGEVIAGFGLSSGSLNLSDPPDITLQTTGDQIVDIGEAVDARITVRNPLPVEFHTLRFSWNGGVLSNTCEVAVRLGAPSGTTTECPACGYPGDPVRDKQFDGHFVNVQFQPSNCGNGTLDSGEECDLGSGNGFGACCDVFCKLEPNDMPCSDGVFCNGDGRCNAGVCQPLGDPCAAAPGCSVCDEVNDVCAPCPRRDCLGDCDNDGRVIDAERGEAIHAVFDPQACDACALHVLDADSDGVVRAHEVLSAHAQNTGCVDEPPPGIVSVGSVQGCAGRLVEVPIAFRPGSDRFVEISRLDLEFDGSALALESCVSLDDTKAARIDSVSSGVATIELVGPDTPLQDAPVMRCTFMVNGASSPLSSPIHVAGATGVHADDFVQIDLVARDGSITIIADSDGDLIPDMTVANEP